MARLTVGDFPWLGDHARTGQITHHSAWQTPREWVALAAALLYTGEPGQMEVDADARAYDALSKHPRAAELAAIARSILATAAQVKRVEGRSDHIAKLAAEMRLSREESATPFGNALDVLQRGPEDGAERALASALMAHVVATFPPKDENEENRLAGDLLWLATHTYFDATTLIDRALGGEATGLWRAIAERIRLIDEGLLPASGWGEALVGGIALASSSAAAAAKHAMGLAAKVEDRKLAWVLARVRTQSSELEPVHGEMSSVRRGPVTTTLLAATGLLLILHVARLFGRIALAYKKTAEVVLLDDGGRGGIRVSWRVEMLGRSLRDLVVVVPGAALMRATREVRYPGVGVYAGLLSLAIGSYIGVSAFADGVRAASPSLLGMGIAIVAAGVALDFGLSSLAPGVLGRCRMLFVARDGTKLCVAGVDIRSADALLGRLAR